MTDLKPCPLCACEKIEYWSESSFHYGDRGYSCKKQHITCEKCKLRLIVRGDEITKEQAFAKWNSRIPLTAQDVIERDARDDDFKMPRLLYVNEPTERPDGSLMYEADAGRFHARHKYILAETMPRRLARR